MGATGMSQRASAQVLLAAGWVWLALFLVDHFAVGDASLIFGTVLFGEIMSSLIVSTTWPVKNSPCNGQDILAHILARWVVLCAALLPAIWYGLSPFYASDPYAAVCLVGLVLGLCLLKFEGSKNTTSKSILPNFRLLIFALALTAADRFTQLSANATLSLVVLSALCLFVPQMRGHDLVRRGPITVGSGTTAMLPIQLVSHIDILLVPFVLQGEGALIYLFARCLAQASPAVLHHIGNWTEADFEATYLRNDKAQFVARAARLNLGVFLIGGALSVIVLAAAPYVARLLSLSGPDMQSVVIWLVLGCAAQVVFGATDLLLRAAGMARWVATSCFASTVLLVVAVMAAHQPNAVFLAQCFAAVHLLRHAVAAVLLAGKLGVWPGLTAVLLKQIKLL